MFGGKKKWEEGFVYLPGQRRESLKTILQDAE